MPNTAPLAGPCERPVNTWAIDYNKITQEHKRSNLSKMDMYYMGPCSVYMICFGRVTLAKGINPR